MSVKKAKEEEEKSSSLPEIFRCDTCGELLGWKQIKAGQCAGHKLKIASKCTLWEWIKARVFRVYG